MVATTAIVMSAAPMMSTRRGPGSFFQTADSWSRILRSSVGIVVYPNSGVFMRSRYASMTRFLSVTA